MSSFDTILKQSGLMKPDEYEAESGRIEAGRQEAVQPYIEAGKKRATREEALRKEVAGMKTPDAPQLQELPEAPQQQYKDPLQALGGMGVILAVAGSLATRAPLTGALDSMASAIEGFHKGDKESLELGRKNWKDNFDKAMAQNNTEIQQYRTALEKSGNDLAKAQAEMHVIAAQNKDDTMLAALESGNFEKQQDLLKDRQNLGEKLVNLQSSHELRTLLYGGGDFDKGSLEAQAAMIRKGVPMNVAVPGGDMRSTSQRRAAQRLAITGIMAEKGMTEAEAGAELARAEMNWKASGGAVNLLTRQRAANEQIIRQLDYNAEQATEQMKKLGNRDISPVVNAIASGVQFWNGEPELGPLFYFMNGAAMEAARLQAGAGASSAQLHAETVAMAKKWSDQRMTLPQWQRMTQAMKAEGEARMRFTNDAINSTLELNPPGNSQPGTPTPGAWNTEKERRFQELKRKSSGAQ